MAVFGLPILLIVILVSIFLSKLILRPAVAAFEKQKQFISDAGHGLKTPLAAISVNAAVLPGRSWARTKYMDCIQSEAGGTGADSADAGCGLSRRRREGVAGAEGPFFPVGGGLSVNAAL